MGLFSAALIKRMEWVGDSTSFFTFIMLRISTFRDFGGQFFRLKCRLHFFRFRAPCTSHSEIELLKPRVLGPRISRL